MAESLVVGDIYAVLRLQNTGNVKNTSAVSSRGKALLKSRTVGDSLTRVTAYPERKPADCGCTHQRLSTIRRDLHKIQDPADSVTQTLIERRVYSTSK